MAKGARQAISILDLRERIADVKRDQKARRPVPWWRSARGLQTSLPASC
jgi:hypothetical protein